MIHCCEHMSKFASEGYDIEYYPSSRAYALILKKEDAYGTHQLLWYCPWCGTRLPEDLGEKWIEILREEYGITDPHFDEADKVPEEFHTEEWWKKRGL